MSMNLYFEAVINLIQSSIIIRYLIHALGVKQKNTKRYAALIGIISSFLYLELQSEITVFEGNFVLLYLIISLGFSLFFLSCSVTKKIVYNILLIILVVFASILAGSLVGIVDQIDYIQLVGTLNQKRYIAMILAQVILAVLLEIILYSKAYLDGEFDTKNTSITLCVPVISVMICTMILNLEAHNVVHALEKFFCIACIFILNGIGFYLLINQHKQYNEQLQNHIRIAGYEQHTLDIETIKSMDFTIRKHQHELQKMTTMMSELLGAKEYEKAIEYLKVLNQGKEIATAPCLYIDHVVLNVLLNRKVKECESLGVSVRCLIQGKVEGIEDIDLHILVENLLENAKEATLLAERPSISFSLFTNEKEITLDITNTVEIGAYESNKNFITTKQNKLKHGLGLVNVREIVEKYHGAITFSESSTQQIVCKVIMMKQ